MKKNQFFLIPFILLLIMPICIGTYQNQNNYYIIFNKEILYVGGPGPGNYTKIQDAIDAASNGDTVFVYSGAYNEKINIDKTIILQGEDKFSTIITNTLIELTENAAYSKISGFTLKPGINRGTGVRNNGDYCIFSNLIITGPSNHGRGIQLWEVDGCHVENCAITGVDYSEAFFIYQTNDIVLRNCTTNSGNIKVTETDNCQIFDCTFQNSLYGITGNPNNLYVKNTAILNSKINGVIIGNRGSNNYFEGCTILNAGSYGMYISSQQDNINVKDCIISGCGNPGIIFWGWDRSMSIINCTFENNELCGLHFFQGWRWVEISNCQFINNRYGISTYGELLFFGRFIDNTFINIDAEIAFLSPPIIGLNKFSGNYWSDYNGVDNDGDGFGDTPYHVFGLLNWDFNPRMTPLM